MMFENLKYCRDTGSFTWKSGKLLPVEAGWTEKDGYRRIRIKGRAYSAHRVAWFLVYGGWPTDEIDHINGDRSDNRIQNLRLASRSLNQANSSRPATNSTGYKGVCFHRRHRKFQASIGLGGKKMHLGYFNTADAAHAAYVEKASLIFGEFSRSK